MMAVASGDGVEKLEDMIVRSAEMTSTHIAAAKAAIGAVIFGQELVGERTLITVLCGGRGMPLGGPRPPKIKPLRALGPVPRPDPPPDHVTPHHRSSHPLRRPVFAYNCSVQP